MVTVKASEHKRKSSPPWKSRT